MILSKSHSVLQWLCLIACLLIIFSMGSCKAPVDKKAASIINTDHLDHLYAEILMNADTVGIIHIYSEYPDYKFVGDADEGMACVDDISRAAIFYLRQFELTKSPASLHKAEKLLKFYYTCRPKMDITTISSGRMEKSIPMEKPVKLNHHGGHGGHYGHLALQ